MASHAVPAAGAQPGHPAAGPAPDWTWEQDSSLRFRRVGSPAAPPPFDPVALIGRTPWEVAGAKPMHGSWGDHERELRARRPFHGFVYMVDPGNDATRFLSVNGQPQFDAAGAFTGYRGTTRDITQQWLQQRRLNEAEVMLKVAATLGGFGAWSVDLVTSRLTWTDKAQDLRHAPASHESEVGRHILGLYAPEDRDRLLHAYIACIASGTPFDLEVQAFDRGRQRRWVRVIGAAVRGPAQEIVGVQGAWQDIHAAKTAAEADRTRARRMRTTLDSLTDSFMTLDRQWRVTYANPTALATVGLEADHLIGQVFWSVFPQTQGSVFEAHYRQTMDHGLERRFEAFYAPMDRWFRIAAFPSEQGIALSFTDITAQHAAHERLLRLNEELEARVQERTEQLRRTNDELAGFTHALAHELREPLAGIAGFSRAVEERLPPPQDRKTQHFLSRIRAGVTRMEGLVDALLELARVGRADLEPRTVNLTALAECSAEALRATEPGREARVAVQQGLQADGDARLLRTLVDNLLAAVWKAAAGHERTAIAVGRADDGSFFVRCEAATPDLSLPPDLAMKGALQTADGDVGGDAIALACARRVVARHGGRIWTDAGTHGGPAFCFTLPPMRGAP